MNLDDQWNERTAKSRRFMLMFTIACNGLAAVIGVVLVATGYPGGPQIVARSILWGWSAYGAWRCLDWLVDWHRDWMFNRLAARRGISRKQMMDDFSERNP